MQPAQIRPRRLSTLLLVAGLLPVLACAQDRSALENDPESATTDLPAVLATVGEEQITLADVRDRAGTALDQVETQYLRSRSRIIETVLDAIVRERALAHEARRQNRTVQDLVAAEAGPRLNPTDAEVAMWYQENASRLDGRPLEQIRQQIVAHLREQRMRAAEQKLEQRISQELKVAVNFQGYRAALDNEGAPSLGRPGAPVTVVEFSDFQCPYCRGFAPTLKQLAAEFGDQVHVVYRQFPITSIHPLAFKAAEASLCAHEQGKFWQLHDLIFEEQTRIAVSDLKDKARRAGIDQRTFDSCLDSSQYAERVRRDMEEAQRLGVTGTPAVFINGVQLEGGAVPYEIVAEAVRRELARTMSRN